MSRFEQKSPDKDAFAWATRVRSEDSRVLSSQEYSDWLFYRNEADKACREGQGQRLYTHIEKERVRDVAQKTGIEPDSLRRCMQKVKDVVNSLCDTDRALLLAWVQAGMPELKPGR
jgi:hypothetical protein